MEFIHEPSFWFSILSALCASYTVIVGILEKKRKPTVLLNWICAIGDQLDVSFTFYNPSSRPITLMGIDISEDFQKYSGINYPDKLASQKEKVAYSSPLPLNINPYQSSSVLIPFKFLPDGLSDKDIINFEFYISGKKIKKRLKLNKKWIDIDQLVRILNQSFR